MTLNITAQHNDTQHNDTQHSTRDCGTLCNIDVILSHYNEHCYAKCHFAERFYVECRHPECRGAILLNFSLFQHQYQNFSENVIKHLLRTTLDFTKTF
jgi:hypothetical protein